MNPLQEFLRLSEINKHRVIMLSNLAGIVSHYNAVEGNWSEEYAARENAKAEYQMMLNTCRINKIPDEILFAAVEGELL